MVCDEQTSLLPSRPQKKTKTPIPWRQLSVVLFAQLSEPMTSQLISPFAPELVRELVIAPGCEHQLGYYVGLLQSAFFLAEAATVLHWSRTSDLVGRKPVILLGLFGASTSMFCFGLSKNFLSLLLSRILNGVLSGNIGVMKSIMAEITDPTNVADVYAFNPLAWSVGGTLGPMIGGSLSRPADQYPDTFGKNTFLKEYPYFLPCAVSAIISAAAWLVTYFFLQETVADPVPLRACIRFKKRHGDVKTESVVESNSFQAPSMVMMEGDFDVSQQPLPLRELLVPRVLIAAGNYALLSLVEITYRVLQPLFFATPVAQGGLGLSPHVIGIIIAVFGTLNGTFQVLFFPMLNRRLGTKKTYIFGISCLFFCFAAFPAMNWIAKTCGGVPNRFVWVVVALQIIASLGPCFAYSASFIFVSAASPNRASLGATNGLSQTTVSFMRGIGPAAASSLFSFSVEKGYLGGFLVYYALIVLAGVAVWAGTYFPAEPWVD